MAFICGTTFVCTGCGAAFNKHAHLAQQNHVCLPTQPQAPAAAAIAPQPAPSTSPPLQADEPRQEEDTLPELDWDQILAAIFTSGSVTPRIQDALLAAIHHKEFEKEKVTLKDSAAVRRLVDEVCCSKDDGWEMETIIVEPGDVPNLAEGGEYTFHFKNIYAIFKEMFGDPSLKGKLAVYARPKYVNHERVYDAPHRANAWISAQNAIRNSFRQTDPESAKQCVVLALQLSSDKTHVNVKGQNCHPVRGAMFNADRSVRERPVLAYFPEIEKGAPRELKLLVLKRCLEVLLRPLIEAATQGELWSDPYGHLYRVFPRILSYVVDDPELRDLLCISGLGSKFPCEVCYTKANELGKNAPEGAQMQRCAQDVIKQQRVAFAISEVEGALKQDVEQWCTAHAIAPLVSGLIVLPGGRSPGADGDYHLWFGYDTLHNDDLGLVPDLVTALCGFIKATFSRGYKKLYKEMNQELASLPRSEDFQPHSTGYFPDFPHAQAREHRHAVMVLPHLFCSIKKHFTGDKAAPFKKVLEVLCSFSKCYMACHRRNMTPSYKESDLCALSLQISANNTLFMDVLGQYLPSGGHTIKRHRHTCHFVDTIRRLGHPEHYTAQHYESDHKDEKRLYRKSGKKRKQVTQGVLRKRHEEAVFQFPEFLLTKKAARNTSARNIAVETGVNQLLGAQRTGVGETAKKKKSKKKSDLITLDALASEEESSPLLAVLSHRPDLRKIPEALKTLVSRHWELYTPEDASTPQNSELGPTIALVNTGYLALLDSVPHGGRPNVVDTEIVRATHSFHGKKVFNFATVSVPRRPPHGGNMQFPAELRALFRCTIMHAEQRVGDFEFALIRKFNRNTSYEVSGSDVLSSCGSYLLEPTEEYSVIPFIWVLKKLHVVPDWGGTVPGRMRFNSFRWERDRSKARDEIEGEEGGVGALLAGFSGTTVGSTVGTAAVGGAIGVAAVGGSVGVAAVGGSVGALARAHVEAEAVNE